MKLIMEFFPWIVAAVGAIWALLANNNKANERDKRKSAEHEAIVQEKRADAQQERAELAEEITIEIVKMEKISHDKIQNAREAAKVSRGRFSGQPDR